VSLPTRDVIRRRAGSITDHGTTVPDWSSSTDTTLTDCRVQPLTGDELLANRDATKTLLRLTAPADVDLLASDRMVVDDVVFEVSDIQRWPAPLPHTSAMLTSWEG